MREKLRMEIDWINDWKLSHDVLLFLFVLLLASDAEKQKKLMDNLINLMGDV